MCKVSIIMPVYNKEKYIRRAIGSILSQTFLEWELIIVDDGSTDASYSICREYTDTRIQIYHVENGGVSRARNTGLTYAKGEYVTFMDSDDYISEDYLEKIYHTECDMVIAGLTKVNLEGDEVSIVFPSLNGRKKLQEAADGFYKEEIDTGIYGFAAGKLIRRQIIEQNHIRFDERIRLAEDYEFYLKIYHKIDTIYFLHYAGYYYLQETENSGIALKDDKIDFFIQGEIQKKTKEFLKKWNCFGKEEERIYTERMTGYVYTILLLNKGLSFRKFILLFSRLKKEFPETTENVAGMERWCISQFKRNRRALIYLYLKLRAIMGK